MDEFRGGCIFIVPAYLFVLTNIEKKDHDSRFRFICASLVGGYHIFYVIGGTRLVNRRDLRDPGVTMIDN